MTALYDRTGSGYAGFTEKKMFGGICFMSNGNMCLGTWKGSRKCTCL